MDIDIGIWRWVFFITALLSFLSIFLLTTIPLPKDDRPDDPVSSNFSQTLIDPWKNFIKLMTARPDFAHFQLIFMFGGLGLMIMQPILPIFTVDVLQLSYTELVIAISVCKGIGFALTTRVWASFFNRVNIYFLTFVMCFFAMLFPVFMMIASIHWLWVYVAYFIYGMMQAGSELCWNLSGPRLRKKRIAPLSRESMLCLSALEVAWDPFLGSFLGVLTNSYLPLMIGGGFCLLGAFFALFSARKFAPEESLKNLS